MRNSYTVVLERMRAYSEGFATEPYEVAWASEAMFFIRVHSIEGQGTRLGARVQVSADGIAWADEGTAFVPIDSVGDTFVKVSHFGGWLRLQTELDGVRASVTLTVHLALKE